MKKTYLYLLLFAGILIFSDGCKKEAHYNALIISGQNNHNWETSSLILQKLLDQTGLFTTDTLNTPPRGGDMTTFDPDFSKYDLVVLDYNGDSWSAKTDSAFLKFVRNGGGVVVYHAADNAFPDWKEYNKIIGLGGWGGRNIESGPYVYYSPSGEIVRDDTTVGIGGTHGARSDFSVRTRSFDHPITRGMPANWMHGNDELYSLLRGPAENMEILATAYSTAAGSLGRTPNQNAPARSQGSLTSQLKQIIAGAGLDFKEVTNYMVSMDLDTAAMVKMMTQYLSSQPGPGASRRGRDEPVLMTITYSKGRIFHTILGHADEPDGGPAMQCVGFIVTFQRGAEWVVSGEVTQEIPFDFPSAAGVVLRTDYEEITLDVALANIGNYEIGKSTKYLNCIKDQIRKSADDENALLKLEKSMVEVLANSDATVDAKKLLLRELSWMGSDYSVSAIEELMSNAELTDEANFALSRLQ